MGSTSPYQENNGAQEGTYGNITTRGDGAAHEIFTHQQYRRGHHSMTIVRARKNHGPKPQEKQGFQRRPASILCKNVSELVKEKECILQDTKTTGYGSNTNLDS